MTDAWSAAVASYGLTTRLALPQDVLADHDWDEVLANARSQRLTGLLAAAVGAGAFPTTDEQYEQTADAQVAAMAVVLRLERLLLDVAEQLAQAGIEVRVLKGSAAAHMLYPDPALRPFNDIDILVPSGAFDDAVTVIARSGGVRQHPQPRPGFDRRFSKGTSFSMPSGLEVDLHRTFVAGPFGLTVQLDDVWAASRPFQIGGVGLHGLDPETCFLGLCYHAALGEAVPRLLPLRDVAQIMTRGAIDTGRVLSLARGWRAEAAVARAVSTSVTTLGLEPRGTLAEWALEYRADRTATRALSAYTHDGNAYGRQAVAAVRFIPGLTGKAAYVRALVWPDHNYVSGRYRSQWDRWGRSVHAVRHMRRDP
jgi:hypothetical protein